MTLLNTLNDVQGTLDAGITSGSTSFVLSSGQGAKFPSANFAVRIDDEIIWVTTRTTDTCSSLVRAAESVNGASTAASHSAGAVVTLIITAELLNDKQSKTQRGAASGYASLGSDTLVPPAELGTRTAVRARQVTLQAMATGWNIIIYEVEDEDTLAEYDTSNGHFTPSTTGWYAVTIGLTMAFGAAGRILLSIGTTSAGGEVHRLFDATSFGAAVTGIVRLTGGTSYTAQLNNASGSSANTTPGGAYCFLNIRRLPNAA